MMGSIIGDIIGSKHEFTTFKLPLGESYDLINESNFYTDDSVLTVATAASIIQEVGYEHNLLLFYNMCNKFKTSNKIRKSVGFGENFAMWAQSTAGYREPYNSCGNGSAMRVSPIGWAFNTAYDVLVESQLSASPTHDHIEGIKGAQATALAIIMARGGRTKEDIKLMLEGFFNYDMNLSLHELHKTYDYEPTCQKTVPQAIFCALEANSFEEAMRNCLYIGGDTDTVCAISGSVAEALFGVPVSLREQALDILKEDGPLLYGYAIEFEQRYGNKIEKIDLSFADKFLQIFRRKL